MGLINVQLVVDRTLERIIPNEPQWISMNSVEVYANSDAGHLRGV